MVPGPRTTPVSVVRFFFQGTAAAPPAPARARGGSDGWRSAQRAIRGRPDRTGGRRRRRRGRGRRQGAPARARSGPGGPLVRRGTGLRRRRLRDPAVALQPGQLLLGPPWLGPAGDHPPPQDQRERRRAERRAGLTRLGGVGADGPRAPTPPPSPHADALAAL